MYIITVVILPCHLITCFDAYYFDQSKETMQ